GMATDFKITQPVEFYRKFLEKDVRPDGRELGETRPTILNIGSVSTANGSALVKQGNSAVICGIKAELCKPKTESPHEGFIIPNIDLPALCSPRFKPGPPCDQAQVYSQLVADVIQNSKCVNPEDLYNKEVDMSWVLYCDMMCLDYDGNILDACILALMAALKSCKLPTLVLDDDGRLEVDTGKLVPLQVHTYPVATTFAIFDDRILFVDPNSEEESIATGQITIVTTEDEQICLLHKPGGSAISDDKMQDALTRSLIRSREARTLINNTIDSMSDNSAER
ncbi:unnamed protein product, partial [Owenia fusiformis]